jgi:hypothetical protein
MEELNNFKNGKEPLKFHGTDGDLSWDYETGYAGLKAGHVYIASMYGEGNDIGQAEPDEVIHNVRLLEHSKDMMRLLDESATHLAGYAVELEMLKMDLGPEDGKKRDEVTATLNSLSDYAMRVNKLLKVICNGDI